MEVRPEMGVLILGKRGVPANLAFMRSKLSDYLKHRAGNGIGYKYEAQSGTASLVKRLRYSDNYGWVRKESEGQEVKV